MNASFRKSFREINDGVLGFDWESSFRGEEESAWRRVEEPTCEAEIMQMSKSRKDILYLNLKNI